MGEYQGAVGEKRDGDIVRGVERWREMSVWLERHLYKIIIIIIMKTIIRKLQQREYQ